MPPPFTRSHPLEVPLLNHPHIENNTYNTGTLGRHTHPMSLVLEGEGMAAGSSRLPGEKMLWASCVKLCIQTKRQPVAGTSDTETGTEVGLEESPGREKRSEESSTPPKSGQGDRCTVQEETKRGLAGTEQVGAQLNHILGTAEGCPERTRRIPRCWVNEDNVKSRNRVLGKPAQPEGEMSLSYQHPAPHPGALCLRDFQYLPTQIVNFSD